MKELFVSNKRYRLFLIGVVVSNAGDYIDDIAFAQLVYSITKSTLFSSYVFAVKIVFSFLNILSATLVDKRNKKKLLTLSCLLQGCLIVCLIFSYKIGILSTPLLLTFVTLQAIFSSFAKPAQTAILPLIVETEDLVEARAQISIADQFIQIVSYAGAGAMIAAIGISEALMVDVISFGVIALLFSFIKIREKITPIKSFGEFSRNVTEGFVFVKSQKVVVIVLLLTFFGNFLVTPIDSLMPAYTSQVKYPEMYFSFYMTVMAVGGICGGFFVTKMQKVITKGVLFSMGYFIGAVSMILLQFPEELLYFCSAYSMGVSISIVSILNASIIQILTPKEMTARVFSIFKCISFTASPLGILIAGMLGEIVLMRWIYGIYGVAMLALTLLSLKFCHIK